MKMNEIEKIIKTAIDTTTKRHNEVIVRSLKMVLESLEMDRVDLAKTHIVEVITILENMNGDEEE